MSLLEELGRLKFSNFEKLLVFILLNRDTQYFSQKKKEEKYVFPYCLSRLNRKKYRDGEQKSNWKKKTHAL